MKVYEVKGGHGLGAAEIDGPDNDGPSELRGMKLAYLTLTDQNAWVENDGPDIGGPNSRDGH